MSSLELKLISVTRTCQETSKLNLTQKQLQYKMLTCINLKTYIPHIFSKVFGFLEVQEEKLGFKN